MPVAPESALWYEALDCGGNAAQGPRGGVDATEEFMDQPLVEAPGGAAAGSPAVPPLVEHPFEFRGEWREYFRIWIVNVALTVLTLGVYSAWAKVRTQRYFYGNTRVAGRAFDYQAQPLPIL